MSPGSPRARIDQFFHSRKRKPSDRDPKYPVDRSPSSTKATLDGYLAGSPEVAGLQVGRGQTGTWVSPRHDAVKKKLSLDAELREGLPKTDADGARITRGSDAVQDGCYAELLRGKAPPCKEALHSELNTNGNPELKKFATDFLSLYCSDLPPAVDIPVESKRRKRSGSPSVSGASSKKQCAMVQAEPTQDVLKESLNFPHALKSALIMRPVKAVLYAEEPQVSGSDGGDFSLRRCSSTPKTVTEKTRTVMPSIFMGSVGKTPNSSTRNSMFSPGDEFWNEAIQFADGLHPADDILTEGLVRVKGERSHSRLPKDESSCAVPQHAKAFLRPVNGSLHSGNIILNSLSQPFVKTAKEPDMLLKVSQHAEASPMPVRHLDFCSGDNLCQNDMEKDETDACVFRRSQDDATLEKKGTAYYTSYPRKEIVSRSTNNIIHEEARTPSSSVPTRTCMKLSNWLPPEICSIYMKKGISELYPWQVECLLVDGVLDKRNLVYCASTSAGKSFVAEILMLRRVLLSGKMALLVLPYVSICAEKAEHLEQLLEPLGKPVRSFYGHQGGGSLPKDTSVAVCTIEKANSLINRLLEEGRLSEMGIIVIDELHMVADPHRGYLLELMLTKLRYGAGEGVSDSSSGESSGASSGKNDPAQGLQIVGMSATMPNVAAVACWLQAALYQTDFRPVPLEEYIKVGSSIYDKKMNIVRMIRNSSDLGGKDPDHVVELCNEVVQEGHSVLLFCSSRKGCESTARHVARFLKNFPVSIHEAESEFSDASAAIEALKKCPAGLDLILEETIPSGVAYHHAGLTVEEREIIETCYRKGLIRVLTATSTLAAGVNLPARRVIFRQPRIGRDFIDGTRYRQMAGRAGRTGIDTKGESILICRPDEVKRISTIVNDSCPALQSCLSEDKNGMTHAIMEVVASGIVQTADDINRYVRCTLLNSTKPFEEVVKSAQDSLRWLCQKKFLEWNDETKLYSTTSLGRAAFGSSLTPEESLVVLNDLTRAREGFVLASDLHLVYLVTPINVDVEPDWELYYQRFMELPAIDQSVGNRVGVVEPFLMRMAHGAPIHVQDRSKSRKKGMHDKLTGSMPTESSMLFNEQTARVSRRFFVALMLSRLVQEVPVADVCEAFKVARGMIQALQENAGRFALMVSLFCERLGWHDLEGLVSKFQNRVSFGVRAEIAELTTIPYVKGSRARALYKAGLRNTLAIAEASVSEIAKALFETSAWAGQDNTALIRMQLGISKKIKNGARKIILEQAEEARIAAFSAFKSLGVHVPQFSKPFTLGAAGGSPLLGSNAGDSLVVEADKNEPTAAKKTVYGKHSASAAAPTEAKKVSTLQEEYMAVNSARKGDSNSEMLHASNVNCTYILAKTSIASSSGKLLPTGAQNSETFPSELAAGHGEILDTRDEVFKSNENDSRAREFKFHEKSISNRGPTNANDFPGGFDCFLQKWASVSEFCFDLHFVTRTNVQTPVTYEILGLAICWENSPVYYCNFPRDLVAGGNQNVLDTWEVSKHRWNKLALIMGRKGIKKITWNLRIQIQALKFPSVSIQRFGNLSTSYNKLVDVETIGSSFIVLPSISVLDGVDISLVTWILWPDEESKLAPNLEKVVKKRLSNEAAAAANRDGRWKSQMRRAAHNGCCRRVAQVRALGSTLWKLLVSEGLVEVLTKIEIPLVEVLADMESWGIGIDMEYCLHARHVLMRKLKQLEKEAYRLAGMSFSLQTSADIANVLYTHLKLPIPQGCSKGKLHPSTNKHSLDLLRGQHPIIFVIKEHRTLAKLLNTTLGSICSRARMCTKTQKYIVQGHWLQTSTATGRLSMEEPNLQCVEHAVVFTIRQTDQSNSESSESDCQQINARDCFIPTQDNWLLVTADYSQIELRLMAHFSKDQALIELLSKPDGDAFTMIASRWTSKPESTISSEERDYTKKLIYGILYGMGANSVAEQLECSPEEAAEKIQSFKNSFPGVSDWLSEAVILCRQKGYIETLMGRKRFLSKIKLGDRKEIAKAQRQAVNSICQGSAADIIKKAMIKVHSMIAKGSEEVISENGFAGKFSSIKGRCRLLLQVHDELVLEADPHLIREAALLLQTSMESAAALLVPLHVKLKVGRTWGSLEPYQPEPFS